MLKKMLNYTRTKNQSQDWRKSEREKEILEKFVESASRGKDSGTLNQKRLSSYSNVSLEDLDSPFGLSDDKFESPKPKKNSRNNSSRYGETLRVYVINKWTISSNDKRCNFSRDLKIAPSF